MQTEDRSIGTAFAVSTQSKHLEAKCTAIFNQESVARLARTHRNHHNVVEGVDQMMKGELSKLKDVLNKLKKDGRRKPYTINSDWPHRRGSHRRHRGAQ